MIAIIIIGVIVFTILVFLALQSKKKSVIALTIVAASVVIIIYIHNSLYQKSIETVLPKHIRIQNATLEAYLNNYIFHANITNLHQKAQVTRMHLEFTLLDCHQPQQCKEIVRTKKILYLDLPPEKTQAIHTSVSFGVSPYEIQHNDTIDWEYTIQHIYATTWNPPKTNPYDSRG